MVFKSVTLRWRGGGGRMYESKREVQEMVPHLKT